MVYPSLRKIKETGSIAADRDHHHQVLTNAERRALAEWILASADGMDPKGRTQVSVKVREMLRARHASSEAGKWLGGSLKLNAQETAAAASTEPRLSPSFFQRFSPWCRAHGIKISEGVNRRQHVRRATQHTEAVVERHFYGEFGLQAELIDTSYEAGLNNRIALGAATPSQPDTLAPTALLDHLRDHLMTEGLPLEMLQVQRSGKTVYLGSFAIAEEAAVCVARSPEGRAAAERAAAAPPAAGGEEEGTGTNPVKKEEGTIPPMPADAIVKEEGTVPPMLSQDRWSDAVVKEEEGLIPPMPVDAFIKVEHAEEEEDEHSDDRLKTRKIR